jgi:hypothetical protein
LLLLLLLGISGGGGKHRSLPKYTGLATDEGTLKTAQWNQQEGVFVPIEDEEFQEEVIEFQEVVLNAVFA